jgi:RHS repeat-associated protein
VTGRDTLRTVGGHKYRYLYDRAGNLVAQRDSTVSSGAVVVTTYAYDALNQLRSVRQGATVIARYGYDVAGRRIAKRVYSAATGGTVGYTRFVYHGSHVAFETDSAGTLGLRYTWGQGTDDLVGVRDAAGTQYYAVQDKVGSIRGLVKRDGTWVLNFTYGPWGRVIDSAGTQHGLLRYRWTGREFDPETGLYFHRTRYYSPAMRHFVQEDPIGYGGGHNVYAYVDGHLLEAVDPDGTRLVDVNGGHGGGGGYNPGRNDMGSLGRNLESWGDFNIWRIRIDATVEVGGRLVHGPYGLDVDAVHYAIRVTIGDKSVMTELRPDNDLRNHISHIDGHSVTASEYRWAIVAVPTGMTSLGFAEAVRTSITAFTAQYEGRRYWPDGSTNSNSFVYNVITDAGGRIPRGAVWETNPLGFPASPGICGGSGAATGPNCR